MLNVLRVGVSIVAAGLVFGLVGCSDSEEVATGGRTSAGQGSQTPKSPQAPPALTKENFAAELAAAQAEAGSAHIEATITAAGQSGVISGDVENLGNLDDVAIDMSLEMSGQQLEMVLVDKSLYIKGAGISPDQAKPWLKLDVSDPNNPFSQIFEASNPSNFIAYLKGATRFEDKGTETVDGVETRHYSVTVDTAKMLAANPAFKGQDASTLGLPDELTSQVYVDSDNLPIKMSVSMGSAASFEAHFSRYGEPVGIKAPPADQVSEFSR